MDPNLITALICGFSACVIYFIFMAKMAVVRSAHYKSKSANATKPPSDIDFIASIIERREQTAREEADQLNKLKYTETKPNDEFEDMPDSENDGRVRQAGSGRKYSHWANQARMHRKQAAAKRRLEALEKQ